MEKSTREEFFETLCNIYMIFVMAVLPLYMKGGYYLIGDTKYNLFRNVSAICLGMWAVLSLVFLLADSVVHRGKNAQGKKGRGYSLVDICVLAYGICNLLAAVCSDFTRVAWLGYRDWHMGALSQLMLVTIYFMVSRHFSGNGLVIYAGEAAFFGVTIIGLLARLGVDLLGVYRGFEETAWEYSHMLSTIGNINWLCGYYSVALVLPIAGYLYSSRRGKEILLYVVSLLGLILLCIQGSDGGFLIAAAGLGISMLLSMRKPERFRKVLLLLLGLAVMLPVMAKLIILFGAQAATPIDGDVLAKIQWNGWWLIAAFVFVVWLVMGRLRPSAQKRVASVLVMISVVTAVMIVVVLLLGWRNLSPESWGSGRGVLWKLAWDSFAEGDWKQKMIGAGPDCYAEYLMSRGITPTVAMEGHWSDAIYANAHNEWLTHLVNIGLLGVGAYFAVFAGALKRYKGMLLGVLLLGMYGVHSLVSFQQVLNTPLFFLLLGLCENRCRNAEVS